MYTTPMRVFDNKYSIVLWVAMGLQLLALQKENNELKISLEGQTTIQTSQQIQEINHLKEQLIKSEQEVNRLKV